MASHAPSSGARGVIQPLNVEQIARKAQDYDYDPCIPLRQWMRAAGSLLKEVCVYTLCPETP
jgi:STAM-binding protein